jgi:hypothetical protein
MPVARALYICVTPHAVRFRASFGGLPERKLRGRLKTPLKANFPAGHRTLLGKIAFHIARYSLKWKMLAARTASAFLAQTSPCAQQPAPPLATTGTQPLR